jgi:hypothetical protein
VAGGHLGEGTRLAAASRAWICFEDEAGQNLRPPKARDVDQLAAIIKNRLKLIQYRPELIGGFLAQTGLTVDPEPPVALAMARLKLQVRDDKQRETVA